MLLVAVGNILKPLNLSTTKEIQTEHEKEHGDVEVYRAPTLYGPAQPKKSGEHVCVLIRTYTAHGLNLAQQLLGWAHMAKGLVTDDPIQHVSVYAVNTHYVQNRTDDEQLVRTMSKAASNIPGQIPFNMHFIELPEDFKPDKAKWGYDATNFLLSYTLDQPIGRDCTRYIFTNGDNSYHKDLLVSLNERIRNSDTDMIGFWFTSRYSSQEEDTNHLIKTAFEPAQIDLGAALVHRHVIVELCPEGSLRFHAYNGNTWAMADWAFYEDALRCGASKSVIPQVLFQHQ